MKEKIIKALKSELDTAWDVNGHLVYVIYDGDIPDVASKIEPLINQEVERRIAERMPSDEERHIAASEYEHKESMGYSEMDKLTGLYRNIDFEAGADWACSRLTNPGDSQKTEGGGE
jgi:hypothetical protein